jgi:hypothetical protein
MFFAKNKAKLYKHWIITLVFEKNANFFRRKLAKIAENCDHNIDPRLWQLPAEGVSIGRDKSKQTDLVPR